MRFGFAFWAKCDLSDLDMLRRLRSESAFWVRSGLVLVSPLQWFARSDLRFGNDMSCKIILGFGSSILFRSMDVGMCPTEWGLTSFSVFRHVLTAFWLRSVGCAHKVIMLC